MAFKIGFNTAGCCEKKAPEIGSHVPKTQVAPRKSVVRVYFAARNMTLAYYNDQFDLHCGDLVYVDGKLAGLRGRVIEVNYNFKIKIADYKRVICILYSRCKVLQVWNNRTSCTPTCDIFYSEANHIRRIYISEALCRKQRYLQCFRYAICRLRW